MSTQEDREWDAERDRHELGVDPNQAGFDLLDVALDPPRPSEIVIEAESVDVEEALADELDEAEPIDEGDFAPAPEFSAFDVWCDFAEEWAAEWRPGPDGPWFCRTCGATDHQRRDHEGAGA